MPHERNRHLHPLLMKMLRYSPIVGILGHRQVGKTTLISRVSTLYKTMDISRIRNAASLDPMTFLSSLNKHPTAIDEVQQCPEIFPALKESVRLNKRPGQFILSGSVRFTSRQVIRESLTGRIVNLELLPFTLSEIESRPINNTPLKLVTQDFPQFKASLDKKTIDNRHVALMNHSQKGGLPGICFVRDEGVRANQLDTNLQTMLDRDLRLIYQTNLRYSTLHAVLAYLASLQGNAVNLTDVSRKTRVSLPTLRHLMRAFENLFLIRMIPSLGGEKASVLFMEDQGEASFLTASRYDMFSNWLRILYANIRIPFLLRTEWRPQFFQYRTRGGAYMPLAVKTNRGILGFSVSLEKNPTEATLKSATSFGKHFKNAKVLILTPFAQQEVINKNVLLTSFAEML